MQHRGKTVLIVGAGFSGTLLAINLLRQPDVRVVLVERDGTRLARGTAYGTPRPEHLLNVRASNMSAYPDEPGHFERWIGLDDEKGRIRFVERATYGRYLQEQLAEQTRTAGDDRCVIITGEAVSARRRAVSGFDVTLRDSTVLECDTLVLAQGNLPPGDLPHFDGLGSEHYYSDPWSRDWLTGLAPTDHVLLLGTGLTAVDAIVSLDKAGFTGKITALSRRGLKPQSHLAKGPHPGPIDRPVANGSHLVRHVRTRAETVGWHAAVDELRPHMQDLWRRLDHGAQRRFLRHLRPYWDVHRHRIAPEIAARLRQWEEEGRLHFEAGKVTRVIPYGNSLFVEWRVRGEERTDSVEISRIINCTGPQGDIRRCSDPLLLDLFEQGIIRSDAHNLGLDVDRFGQTLNSDGRSQTDLVALGPLTKGEAWEVIAVPDIRRQVWDIARAMTHANWVGGEGL